MTDPTPEPEIVPPPTPEQVAEIAADWGLDEGTAAYLRGNLDKDEPVA